MISFFLDCKPPTSTAQQKGLYVGKDGKAHSFKKKSTLQTGATLSALLLKHQPAHPIAGPVRLELIVVWPYNAGHHSTREGRARCLRGELIPHISRPDLDNWKKEFQDLLVTLGFIEADQRVCSEANDKVYGPRQGIAVRITPLEAVPDHVHTLLSSLGVACATESTTRNPQETLI